ncbi:hypothetical protein D9M70_563040 [compost metagenome]
MVALAAAQVGFYYPNPVQFPAYVIRIEVVFRYQFFVIFDLKRTVTVVGNILLLFTYNLPVEAIEPTSKGRDFIETHHASGGR